MYYFMLICVSYRKSNRGDIFFGCLHQEVHPKVHQLLFVGGLLYAGLVEVLKDQDGLHQ